MMYFAHFKFWRLDTLFSANVKFISSTNNLTVERLALNASPSYLNNRRFVTDSGGYDTFQKYRGTGSGVTVKGINQGGT